MPPEPDARRWRVRRHSGLLVPGFGKRFDLEARIGLTDLTGIPVGAFDVHEARGTFELRYHRWPIVDVLDHAPGSVEGAVDGTGYVRLPGGRRMRFCRFVLEPPSAS